MNNVIKRVEDEKFRLLWSNNYHPTLASVVYLGKSEIAELRQYLVYSSEKVGNTDDDMLLGLKLICVDRETYLAVH